MMTQLDTLFSRFTEQLNQCGDQNQVANLKAEYLGKKGPLSDVLKGMKDAAEEERRTIGAKANALKDQMQELLQQKLDQLELSSINQKLEQSRIDTSLRQSLCTDNYFHGGIHPTNQVQQEIEDIFISMGFEVLDGPHIEDEFHNFEALNIPKDHPARDMQDTFWFHHPQSDVVNKKLLRTHTSCIQV